MGGGGLVCSGLVWPGAKEEKARLAISQPLLAMTPSVAPPVTASTSTAFTAFTD